MNDPEFNKVRFLNKYGSTGHKVKADAKIGEMIKHGSTPQVHTLASSTELNLSSEHVHGIIDHKVQGEYTHPAKMLASWNKPSLKDEHWHKLATHPDPMVSVAVLPNAPMKHVKTIAQSHPDEYVRQLATNHYHRRIAAGIKE